MSVDYEAIATTLGVPVPAQDSAEAAAWTMWISDALLRIRLRLGDPFLLDQDVLDYVVREAVAAKARNPDAVSQQQISVDDGSVSKTYSKSTGQVTITDDWWELLTPPTRSQRPAFTINTEPRWQRFLC